MPWYQIQGSNLQHGKSGSKILRKCGGSSDNEKVEGIVELTAFG